MAKNHASLATETATRSPENTDPGLLAAWRAKEQLAKKWRARWMARKQTRVIKEVVKEAA